MKKELGVHPYLFPMPVLMIATYGDDDTVDVMNMAWGGICAENIKYRQQQFRDGHSILCEG